MKRGTLKRRGKEGSNELTFTGRIARKALKRARHRVVATARAAKGGTSTARRAAFRVVAR